MYSTLGVIKQFSSVHASFCVCCRVYIPNPQKKVMTFNLQLSLCLLVRKLSMKCSFSPAVPLTSPSGLFWDTLPKHYHMESTPAPPPHNHNTHTYIPCRCLLLVFTLFASSQNRSIVVARLQHVHTCSHFRDYPFLFPQSVCFCLSVLVLSSLLLLPFFGLYNLSHHKHITYHSFN